MELKTTIDGHDLREMFSAGAAWLEKIVPDINALNVYPVPDGDCGTNMLCTIRASIQEVAKVPDGSASEVAKAIAYGALLGARGNSGVILSQIWHGLAKELQDKDIIDAKDLAQALQEAANTAYLALSNPVEGTILTVIHDAAAAANKEILHTDADSISVLTAAVGAARESVLNTPNLLSVLREAGVVDAGGHGLFTFLEGALLYIIGKMDGRSPELLSTKRPLITQGTELSHEDDFYGFCTQFMIKGQNLNIAKLRNALQDLGESLIVVGDKSTVRVHIHTHDADTVTQTASSLGKIFDVDIRNMDEQHQDFLLMKQGKATRMHNAVIAIVNGDGLVTVFADLGVAAVVPGGQTINPSTMDILRTVERVDSDNIIILPNNKNVIPTALLVQSLTTKNIKVITTETIPQGISAMVEFVPEASFQSNVTRMAANTLTVKTIEITRATRSAKLNKLDIKRGQFIGMLDGELLAVSNAPDDTVFQLLSKIDLAPAHMITLYFGKGIGKMEANNLKDKISQGFPQLEIGVVDAGQPYYQYIISIE